MAAAATRSSPSATSCSTSARSTTTARTACRCPGAAEVTKVATGVSAQPRVPRARASTPAPQLVLAHHGLFWGVRAARAVASRWRRGCGSLLGAEALAGRATTCRSTPTPRSATTRCSASELGFEPDDRAVRRGPRARRSGRSGAAPSRSPAAELVERGRRADRARAAGLRRRARRGRARSGSSPAAAASQLARGRSRSASTRFVTGEPTEHVMGDAREGGIHFIAAGHYATETLRHPAPRRAGRRALRRSSTSSSTSRTRSEGHGRSSRTLRRKELTRPARSDIHSVGVLQAEEEIATWPFT